MVRTLLEARADVDCDDEGESVLSVAAKLGNWISLVSVLFV